MDLFSKLNSEKKNKIVLFGNEPVQVNNYYTQIFNSRVRQNLNIQKVILDKKSQTKELINLTSSISLFEERSFFIFIIKDLRLSDDIKNYITDFFQSNHDDFILFHYEGESKDFLKSAFYKTISTNALCFSALEPKAYEFKKILTDLLGSYSLNLSSEGLNFLEQLSQGNLIYANNALKKLELIYENNAIDEKDLLSCLTDNSKYNGFNLINSCFSGNLSQTKKIINFLKEQNTDPILINGLLSWFFSPLLKLKTNKLPLTSDLLIKFRIFGDSQNLIRFAIKHLTIKQIEASFNKICEIDQIAKGIKYGDAWSEIDKFISGIAFIISKKKNLNS
jgi:DNA polymerase-3 subunit delta